MRYLVVADGRTWDVFNGHFPSNHIGYLTLDRLDAAVVYGIVASIWLIVIFLAYDVLKNRRLRRQCNICCDIEEQVNGKCSYDGTKCAGIGVGVVST